MRRAVPFVVVGLLTTPALAGMIDNSPIVGGTSTAVGDYPSVVAIEINGGLCTGTLVTKDWVLTAAHCVLPSEVGLSSQAAVTAALKIHIDTVSAFSGGQTLAAADSMPDPMFNINNLGSHDAGLIKLKVPVTDVKPTPINLVAADAPVGIMVTMVGFGATGGTGAGAGVERVVQQTSIACSLQVGTDANLLCFNQVNGKGKCNGDSGGPSFAMIRGRMVEVGITSFGDQTCSQFGADTRVDAEKAFLLQHVPELQCTTDADCPDMKTCFQQQCIVAPFQPTGLGATCAGNTDCDSGQCGTGADGSKCVMACTAGDNSSCPDGFDCLDNSGGGGVCWPHDGGCCDASGRGAPTTLIGIAIVGLVWRRRRRR